MRTLSFILLAVCYGINFSEARAQLLRGLDKAIIEKTGFERAVKQVDEEDSRFFYKKSTTAYIFKDTDSDLDANNKSYTDIRLSKNADTIIAKTYTYQMSSHSFVLSATIHGDEGNQRMTYKRIKEDVYVAIEDLSKKKPDLYNVMGELGIITDTVPFVSYLLYNTTDGLYYHRFFYKLERTRYTATYASHFEYVGGAGIYRKSKKYKLNKEELEASKKSHTMYGAKLIEAFNWLFSTK